jgi:hypothetical protein
VEVAQASKELLEAALDLGGAHTTFPNGSIQVSTRAKLHDLAPGMVLILHEIDRLDDIEMMEGRGDAKLRSKLLDVFLFGFILSTLPELLENKGVQCGEEDRQVEWGTVP